MPPEDLSRPLLRMSVPAMVTEPSGPISPVIDGEVTSYFEWLGAAGYRVDERSGSMHGNKAPVAEVQFGTEGRNFYLRIDFRAGIEHTLAAMEFRINLQPLDDHAPVSRATISLAHGAATGEVHLSGPGAVECAFARVLEVSVPLPAIGVAGGRGLRFQCSLWEAGLPIEAIPQQGWLELKTTDPALLAG
jgi:hypothetical protein